MTSSRSNLPLINRKISNAGRSEEIALLKRACVIEDDRHMRRVLGLILREQGYEDVGVGSAEEAEDHLLYRAYDMALIDVGLGGRSGIDLVRGLRNARGHINRKMPIVIVSAQHSRTVIEAARDSGADAYLVKPVASVAITAKINQLETRRRPFIDEISYCGPDRRWARSDRYAGPERRGAGPDSIYV